MRFRKVFGIRRPLRSLPVALVSLALAERLGGEVVAATELALREQAAISVTFFQPKLVGHATGYVTDTILHDLRDVADLYQPGFRTD